MKEIPFSFVNWDAIGCSRQQRRASERSPSNQTLSRIGSVRRSMQVEAMLGRQSWPSEQDVAEAVFDQFTRELV